MPVDFCSNFVLQHQDQVYVQKVQANIEERFEVKRRLQCKSFDWFLDNVYPEFRDILDRQYGDAYRKLVPTGPTKQGYMRYEA